MIVFSFYSLWPERILLFHRRAFGLHMDILTIVDLNTEKKSKKEAISSFLLFLIQFFLIFFSTAGTYFAFLSTVSLCVECFILIFVSDKKRYCDTSHAEIHAKLPLVLS